MSQNSNTQPAKSILKQDPGTSGGSDKQSGTSKGSSKSKQVRNCKFDEMNIIETYHPPDKDYGHMTIDEPKTPYSKNEEPVAGGQKRSSLEATPSNKPLNPNDLASQLNKKGHQPPKSSVREDTSSIIQPPPRMGRNSVATFTTQRKAHYNEFQMVKKTKELFNNQEDSESLLGPSPASTTKSSKTNKQK